MVEVDASSGSNVVLAKKMLDLSPGEKCEIAQWLIIEQKDGKARYGAQVAAATKFHVSLRTVASIWQHAKQQTAKEKLTSFSKKKKGYTKRIHLDVRRVEALSVLQRISTRKMADHLNMSKLTLHRCIKAKELRPHTNAVKPSFTDANKIARLKFSLSNLDQTNDADCLKFQKMHNIVHIDEKWFFITNTSDRYYLLPHEDELYRSTKSKRFITKVMFLCAVARPQFSDSGALEFDGKIRIFPLTTQVPAMRRSKNRSKGTLETKPIQNVTKAVIKDCLITKVIPAIKIKWPHNQSKKIIILQDNARPHLQIEDSDFTTAANTYEFKIKLLCQPSNSPDANVNDLGFFRAIQSLQTDTAATNVDELIANVIKSYEALTAETINKVFLTLQGCLIEIMKVKGGNNYKILHMKKGRLERPGDLLLTLEVEGRIVKECLDYLHEKDLELGSLYEFNAISKAFGF